MTINGISYDVLNDIVINEHIDDTLDTCDFYLYSDIEIDFTKWQEIAFSLNGTNKYFSLFEWSYDTSSHKYHITGIESTRILDELVIEGFAQREFSNVTTALNYLGSKLNQRIAFAGYTLSFPETIDFSGASDELTMGGLITVREIIDEFLSTYDRAVRVTRIISNVIYLTFDNPNARESEINIDSAYEKSIQGNEITSSLVTDAKNMITVNPYTEPYRKATSGSFLFDTNNAVVETILPVYELTQLLLSYLSQDWSVTFDYTDTDGFTVHRTTKTITGICIFNITSYCLNKEEYDTLDYDDSFKYMYYEKGKKNIKHLLSINDSGVLINESTYELMLDELLGEQSLSPFGAIGSILTYSALTSGLSIYPNSSITIQSISGTDVEWYDALYKTTYYPLADNLIKVGGAGTSIIDNQTVPILSEERFISSLESKLNRIGNVEITYDKNGTVPFEIGDTYGDYVIDERTLSINANNIKQHYHLTKNYNALNEATKIRKEYRLYTIPTEGYVKSVFEMSGKALSDYANGFDNISGIIIIANSNYVFLPKIDNGNNITFRFTDNYSALNYLTYTTTWLTVKRYMTKGIPYVDQYGRFTSMTVRLVKKNADNITNYPYVSLSDFTVYDTFTVEYNKDALEQFELVIYKEK